MVATIPADEFRKIILRNYYLGPCGVGSKDFKYIPITKETLEGLGKDPAFTENQIKTLESRVID